MVRSLILKQISSTTRGIISGQHGILIWCWDSCAFGALWWIELLLAKFGCVILHFCYDDNVRFVYWLGALCWTPPKLLGLHSWRWNKHGSKCALPDVRVCAWKCLFEQSLPIICTFIPSFTSDAFASSSSNSKRTLFLHLYAAKSAQFDVFSSNIRFYTFIYDGKRLFERHANKKTYIRLYTFIYVWKRFLGNS